VDIYDPALNPLYRDVLAHYGVVAVPCRVATHAVDIWQRRRRSCALHRSFIQKFTPGWDWLVR
jgi:hypothetical protein